LGGIGDWNQQSQLGHIQYGDAPYFEGAAVLQIGHGCATTTVIVDGPRIDPLRLAPAACCMRATMFAICASLISACSPDSPDSPDSPGVFLGNLAADFIGFVLAAAFDGVGFFAFLRFFADVL